MPWGLEIDDQIFVRSCTNVFRRFERGVWPIWSRMTKKRRDLGVDLGEKEVSLGLFHDMGRNRIALCGGRGLNILPVLLEYL